MWLEGHGHRLGISVQSTIDDFAKNVRVRAMHAVEIANTYDRRSKSRRYFFEVMKDIH
jgi:hypothetical protein